MGEDPDRIRRRDRADPRGDGRDRRRARIQDRRQGSCQDSIQDEGARRWAPSTDQGAPRRRRPDRRRQDADPTRSSIRPSAPRASRRRTRSGSPSARSRSASSPAC